jgi:nucleoside-diphosphate-sugar epimerase
VTRVLVTGANGFVGSHVCARLARDGHEVVALVRPRSSTRFLEGIPARVVRGDVTDVVSLAPAVAGAGVVVHVAGLASDWGPLSRFLEVNLQGTKNAAHAAAEAGVARFVHVSSATVHGFAGYRDADESSPTPPSPFPYVESKRRAEAWLFGTEAPAGLEVVALRPGNVFGERDHTFLDRYADVLAKGGGAYVNGGRAWTCPVYAGNLADAVERACFAPGAAGLALLVTDGLEIDWRTFTERLCDAMGVAKPKLSVPLAVGWPIAAAMEGLWTLFCAKDAPLLTRYRILNGGRDYHFSIRAAKRALGWEPKVGLYEALARSVASWRSRRA